MDADTREYVVEQMARAYLREQYGHVRPLDSVEGLRAMDTARVMLDAVLRELGEA